MWLTILCSDACCKVDRSSRAVGVDELWMMTHQHDDEDDDGGVPAVAFG
jgi:hypothetical protein